jgi:CheY-like chemotaxis protein
VDDRARIEPGDRAMLIIEDDRKFAHILLDAARQRGFKGLIATRGESAWGLVTRYLPTAITLDIHLPDIDGWKILGRLKDNPATRHIPVTIISVDDDRWRGLRRGALDVLRKPVEQAAIGEALDRMSGFAQRPVKRLLLLDGDGDRRARLQTLMGNGDIAVAGYEKGLEALGALELEPADCIVLGPSIPDMPGPELLDRLKGSGARSTPILIYSEDESTGDNDELFKRLSHQMLLKEVRTAERLMDEIGIFLHRRPGGPHGAPKKLVAQMTGTDAGIEGRIALIVDDDMRNLFALTSLLERHGAVALPAESGADGLAILESREDIDIVLMDVMMPEMDGYEVIGAIRNNPRFKDLPIIAVTAKVMQGDRERCLEAGASEYMPKPIDIDYLLMMMRELVNR